MSAAEVERHGGRGAWVGVVVILVVAWLLVLLGVLGIYLYRTLYNEQVFAKRVTAVLQQPDTQSALATGLTNAVIKEVPKAVVARPLIQSAAATVVAEPAFTSIVTAALVKFHQILLDPGTANLVFTIEGAPQLIEDAIRPYDEQLAVAVGNAASAQIAKIPNPGPAFQLIQIGSKLGAASWVVALIGLGLGLLAALIAPSRRKGAIAACLTLAAVGLTLALVLSALNVGIGSVTATQPVLNQMSHGVFEGLFGDLRTVARVLAIVGVIAGVLVWSLRWTAPMAVSAAQRAKDSAALEGAQDAAGKALGSAQDSAAGALATTGSREVEVQDVMVAVRSGIHRVFTPASTTAGRLVQAVGALLVALLVLFQWAIVVDVIVLAIAIGLFALALNRIMIVVLQHRANRELQKGEEQTAVGAGSGD